VLCVPWAWTARRPALPWLRLAGAASGIVMVLYLIAVEAFVVRAICLWCTAVHVVTFVLFLAVLTAFLADEHVVSGASTVSARRA
jgi:uncharacterized membrane protein